MRIHIGNKFDASVTSFIWVTKVEIRMALKDNEQGDSKQMSSAIAPNKGLSNTRGSSYISFS